MSLDLSVDCAGYNSNCCAAVIVLPRGDFELPAFLKWFWRALRRGSVHHVIFDLLRLSELAEERSLHGKLQKHQVLPSSLCNIAVLCVLFYLPVAMN